jgi:hypothetical protein
VILGLEKGYTVADTNNLAGLDATQSVSALGLRWAALRGMLTSPLIMTEDQRPLREELLREIGTIEQDFSALPSRNTMEIWAKIDIAKSALQERAPAEQAWLVDLLSSVQGDLQAFQPNLPSKPQAGPTGPTGRSTANLTRSQSSRPEDNATPATEGGASSAA